VGSRRGGHTYKSARIAEKWFISAPTIVMQKWYEWLRRKNTRSHNKILSPLLCRRYKETMDNDASVLQ
jgi:hypothetical protein